MKIDTGAEVTVIGLNHLQKFGLSKDQLLQPERKLIGPDKHKFKCYGCFTSTMQFGKKDIFEVIYVCEFLDMPLLGQPAIENLDLIAVNNSVIGEVTAENEQSILIKDIVEDFKEVFEGLGLVKGRQVHIDLEDQSTPFHISAP